MYISMWLYGCSTYVFVYALFVHQNYRRATHLGVYYHRDDGHPGVSRSCTLDTYDAQTISKIAWSALCKTGKNGRNITSSWLVCMDVHTCVYFIYRILEILTKGSLANLMNLAQIIKIKLINIKL